MPVAGQTRIEQGFPRQIIEAKWKETGGDKGKAWEGLDVLSNTPANGERKPKTTDEKNYLGLLERLGMKNSGKSYSGIKPYVTGLNGTPIWNEAAVTFGNYALFSGAPANLYTRLMGFYANSDCHIAAVKQMFELEKCGYVGKHADPKDSITEKWVKKTAAAWNGSKVGGDYAAKVFAFYKYYYLKYFGKAEVCN